jgi:glucose-6-phosphate dehydrogenase assembly protein OpcA
VSKKLEDAITDGWEGLNEISLDIRDSQQAVEDLNKLCLRVLGTEDGKKLMGWLRASTLEQPVATPGSDSSYAYYREGQNSIVRDLEARLIKARKM